MNEEKKQEALENIELIKELVLQTKKPMGHYGGGWICFIWGIFSFVGVAIRARPVSLIFEQFIAWRRMGVVTLYTIGAHCRFPVSAPLLVVVALNAKGRDLFFEKFFQ